MSADTTPGTRSAVKKTAKKISLLITGSGGREHGLAFRVARSPLVDRVYVAPGNAGTALEPGVENVDIQPMDFDALLAFAREQQVGLTIIGPEMPLVAGVVDRFQAAGLACIGPLRLAARLEGSKSFAKHFLEKYHIPTAAYQVFTQPNEAIDYLQHQQYPVVIKADGLAAGKGVVIAADRAEAEGTVKAMLGGTLVGDAGSRIVIEEFLVGEEASFIVIADGVNYVPFASSQDHKAAFDGDRGPNTGGMGACSPAPVVTDAVHQRILDEIISPTLSGMRAEGHPYTGFLYAGLMIDAEGMPRVIEFNCRCGDPETQPLMSRMKSDLVQLCLAAVKGELANQTIEFDRRAALTVVIAAEGYPGNYDKGKMIEGLDDIIDETVKVFHAGTVVKKNSVKKSNMKKSSTEKSRVLTNGGRVLGVTALGDNVTDAQRKAYAAVQKLKFSGMRYRTDIGDRAVRRESLVENSVAIS